MFRSALFPLFACVLLLSACSDVRSPDLPPAQLAGIGALNCEPTALGLGQSGQCTFDPNGCQFLVVREDGNQEFVAGACPAGVELTSSNPGIVSVDNSGVFVGNMQGTADIVATLEGISSEPETITVGPACIQALEIQPLGARITAGRNQPYRAFLDFSNGNRPEVTATSVFEFDEAQQFASFNGNVLQSDQSLPVETTVAITVTNENAGLGNLCEGVAVPLQASTSVTLVPGALLAIDGLCIDSVPPATAFDDAVCRADTGACVAAPIQLNLEPPETLNLQLRARYNNGLECNVAEDATLEIDPVDVATLDVDALTVTAEMSGTATLTAAFDGQTEERDVVVGNGMNPALGASSLAVSARELIGGAPYSFSNAQRFACIGQNDLEEGLAGGSLAGQLNVFAKSRSCEEEDLIEVNGRMVCSAPSTQPGNFGQPSDEAFNDLQRLEDFTNPMPEGANPFDDATTWAAVEGFWNGESCEAGAGNSPAGVGDVFFADRTLVPGRGLAPTTQPNGVVFADGALRLGFSCVTATIEDPSNPGQMVTDGMTVLVLPLTNDVLTDPSDPNAGEASNQLCDTLLPIFSNPLLAVLQNTPLDALGRIELVETLSTITEIVNPLLEQTDAIPLGLIIDTLLTGGGFLPAGLQDLTELLIRPIDDMAIDPGVAPLLCTITGGVNSILSLITNSEANQECLGGGGVPGVPGVPADVPVDLGALQDVLDLLGLGDVLDLLGLGG
jgi:hypothetical protein